MSLLDRYSKNSSYLISKYNNEFFLLKDNKEICKVDIINAPEWYEKEISPGIKAADIIRQHDKNVLSCNPFRDCIYFQNELKCRFCSYGTNKDRELSLSRDESLFVKAIKVAFESNANYELNISIGTWPSPDRGAKKVIGLIQKIKENVDPKFISLEMAPPKDLSYINELKFCGVSSIMFNLEFYDDKFREIFCPGKARIKYYDYKNAWVVAVEIFGKWRVGSVLIAGIEPLNSTKSGIDMLLELGVIPIIMPFKPLDESMLSELSTSSPNEMKEVQSYLKDKIVRNKEIRKVLKERGLGCLTCPGCSL